MLSQNEPLLSAYLATRTNGTTLMKITTVTATLFKDLHARQYSQYFAHTGLAFKRVVKVPEPKLSDQIRGLGKIRYAESMCSISQDSKTRWRGKSDLLFVEFRHQP